MTNRVGLWFLITMLVLTPILAVAEPLAGGPMQYAGYRCRLALIDPEQGWAAKARIIDAMATARRMSRDYAFLDTLRMITNGSFGRWDAVRVQARTPSFLGRDREAVARDLPLTRTRDTNVDRYEIIGFPHGVYELRVTCVHDVVTGVTLASICSSHGR